MHTNLQLHHEVGNVMVYYIYVMLCSRIWLVQFCYFLHWMQLFL